MKEVMQKAQELAEAIADSETYQTMKRLERDMFKDETAAALLAEMNHQRNRVEEILSSTNMNPEELAEASQAMEKAEKAMLENGKIQQLKAARKDFQTMMDNVNKILRLVVTGEVGEEDTRARSFRSACSGDCRSCGGCN